MDALKVSASLRRAHTVARSAGSTNSPDIVTAMALLSLKPSAAFRQARTGGCLFDEDGFAPVFWTSALDECAGPTALAQLLWPNCAGPVRWPSALAQCAGPVRWRRAHPSAGSLTTFGPRSIIAPAQYQRQRTKIAGLDARNRPSLRGRSAPAHGSDPTARFMPPHAPLRSASISAVRRSR